MSMVSSREPPIWFMEGMSTLTPYNVGLVLLVNHYFAEPYRTKFKLGVILLECIKFRNLSLNQLIALLNDLDDGELGAEFLDYLERVFKNASIVVLKKLLGNLGSTHALMMNPEEPIKPNSPFGLFLRHMIISFELASFEQLSMFLQDLKTYIENKDKVFPLISTKQQEAVFCREVAKFQSSLSLDRSNAEIHEMCRGSNEKRIQQAEILQYLNYLSVKEYNLAKKHLHQYFTMMMNSRDEIKNIRPFSALSLAAMHTMFQHNDLAMQYLKESIHLGQLLGEESCLSQCIAWTSYLQGAPITRPTLSKDSDAVPSELEIVGHIHTLESMCKNGEKSEEVLKYMSVIAPITSRAQYHTNATQVFRWYGNSLLSELHPFFIVLQLCPDWLKDGHMITLSNDTTALCAALCNLALALSQSPAAPVSCSELLNFALSLFPCLSSHRQLLYLTLNSIHFTHKRAARQKTDSEEALIRSISSSTRTALTSTDDTVEGEGDVYITREELKARVMYNSAKADLPSSPSQAVQKLLNLILYSKTYNLQEHLVNAHLLLTEAQILLELFEQALLTIESVFVLAMSSNSTYTQSNARFLYVQAKLATCSKDRRYQTFQNLENHLKLSLEGFLALTHARHVGEVFYFLARLYDEFGLRDDRNKCAKKFRNFHQNLTVHDPL